MDDQDSTDGGEHSPRQPPITPQDKATLRALATRFRRRRQALGLTMPHLATLTHCSVAIINNWSRALPVRRQEEVESILEEALQVPPGWLRDPAMVTPRKKSAKAVKVSLPAFNAQTAADEIMAIGLALSSRNVADAAANPGSPGAREQRTARIFAQRYGVSGPDQATLQAVGDAFGLTRERVRQIVDKLLSRMNGHELEAPRLMAVQQAMTESSGKTVELFDRENRGLLGQALCVEDVARVFQDMLKVPFARVSEASVMASGNSLQAMIVGERTLDLASTVRAEARRMIRSSGAAHLYCLVGLVAKESQRPVGVPEVLDALDAIDGMQWLTPEKDWFWLRPDVPNNRALDSARKMLAVAGKRLDIEELQQGICRSRRVSVYRFSNPARVKALPPFVEAPLHVLASAFSRTPWLKQVQFDDFVLTEPLYEEEVLGTMERLTARVIRSYGGIAARFILKRELVDAGKMSLPGLQITLAQSPIIRPMGHGLYALRGVDVKPDAMERILAEAPSGYQPTVHVAGLDEQGWCECEVTVSAYMLGNAILDLPAAVARTAGAGEFRVEGLVHGEVQVGTVSAPGRIRRLATMLRSAGVGAGTRLRLRLHPGERRIAISIVEQDSVHGEVSP